MVLLPCSKCCGPAGPCWRCHGKNFLCNYCVNCDPDLYDFYLPQSITIQVTDKNDTEYIKEMPFSSAFQPSPSNPSVIAYYGEDDEPNLIVECNEGGDFPFEFYTINFYGGPDTGICYDHEIPLDNDIVLKYNAGLSCDPQNTINDAKYYVTFPNGPGTAPVYINWNSEDAGLAAGQDFCNSEKNSISVVPAYGYTLRGSAVSSFLILNKTSGEDLTGPFDPNYNPSASPSLVKVFFNIQRTEKDTPPDNFLLYQCFDAPPTEAGWQPVGKCHSTEQECAAECPPTTGGRAMPTTTGPGTELAKLLRMLGIDAKEKGCSCKSHAKRMDREGPRWCRENIETILGWLQTEAKKRRLPFIKTAAKQVVLLAIRRAERG